MKDPGVHLSELRACTPQPEGLLLGSIHTKIMGVRHYDVCLEPNDRVILKREPENAYDPHAIAVHDLNGDKAGHLPRRLAKHLAPVLDEHAVILSGTVPDRPEASDWVTPLDLEFRWCGAGTDVNTARTALVDALAQAGITLAWEREETPVLSSLDHMLAHLEFLGFTIHPEDGYCAAVHPLRANILIRPWGEAVTLTSTYNASAFAKADREGYLLFVNHLNTQARVARVYADKDLDLVFEAFLLAPYERKSFGLFLDLWDADSRQALSTIHGQAETYLM